jgi:hypothetical protein
MMALAKHFAISASVGAAVDRGFSLEPILFEWGLGLWTRLVNP